VVACSEAGFETITLQQTTILNRDVGGRQYGAWEDIERSKSETMLRLADLEQSRNAVLHSLGAASDGHAIDEFIGWYCAEKNLAVSTINVRFAAVRRLACEACFPRFVC
jgi:hypothetical protein